MRIALTGSSGIAGEALLRGLKEHHVTTLGRRRVKGHHHIQWSLEAQAPDLAGFDALVHAAFSHVPGRYRGGEGDDPGGFRDANLEGSRRLFEAALDVGVQKVIFLSSRAVFDGCEVGTALTEDTPVCPGSLYGEVKSEAESFLFSMPLQGIALRATGLFGPGRANKWAPLFADYLAGRPVAPRRGTELHVDDLASATQVLLTSGLRGPVHASDILIDRHELLSAVQSLTGCPHDPPPPSDRPVNSLSCDRLRKLGWHPGGWSQLEAGLPDLLPEEFFSPEMPPR